MKIAVLLPCYNEEGAIAKTVADFRAALPDAAIYVYDNNSTDRTAEVARAAGAIVRTEPTQGKGNVVRRQFADIEADIYVMADGDDTYDAGAFAGIAMDDTGAFGPRRSATDDDEPSPSDGPDRGNSSATWRPLVLFIT